MKLLVDPLLWYVTVMGAALFVLQKRSSGSSRRWLRVLLLLTTLLAAASTRLVGTGLELTLDEESSSEVALMPAFIFVLGGGYIPGEHPDEDTLVHESQQRVLHGVSVWRRYPRARLVFSGAAAVSGGVRPAGRLAELMAQAARDRGVPDAAIVLEPRSRNTREHPVEALKLPDLDPQTPIAVVTSRWHQPRANREFERHFTHVYGDPVPAAPRRTVWQDFVPTISALNANTTLAREWVGMLWYSALDLARPAVGRLE